MIELDHEQRVVSFYTERTEEFYLRRWDADDIHFGIFRDDEPIDPERYQAGSHLTVKRALRRMTDTVVAPAQIKATDFVVDAGCGVAGTAIYLAQTYGCKVSGVNICQPQIDIAKRKIQQEGVERLVDVRYADCSKRLPFDDRSVDVIVNLESACHYSDRAAFLTECARILKPGGRLVAQDVIAKDGIDQTKIVESACDAWAMHFPLETPSSYRSLLLQFQFEVVELAEIDGFQPTTEIMKQGALHLRSASQKGYKLSAEEQAWLRQFDTMALSVDAGHLTLLRYYAQCAA